MALNVDTLVRCGVPREKARAHLPLMAAAMREHGIATRRRARMFIAQVMHESASLRYFEEIASGAAYEGRRDLGNVRPGDGRRFKGRGPIQLTGRHNYTLYGKLLGLDLVGRPELAATPRVGWRTAALYFQRAGCNQAADQNDFRKVTRLINGGLNGLPDRLRLYRLLEGMGVVPGEAYLSRGDKGDAVVTMTRRLSYLRSRKTGKRYLDGRRSSFDREAVLGLRRFQAEHGLTVDGRFGPRSAQALAAAVAKEKKRRSAGPARTEEPRREATNGNGAPPEREVDPPAAPATRAGAEATRILGALERLDRRSDRLRRALVARGQELEQALNAPRGAEPGPDDPAGAPAAPDDLDEQLRRIEEMIQRVREGVAGQDRATAAAQAGRFARPAEAPAAGGGGGKEAAPAQGAPPAATTAVADPPPREGAPENGAATSGLAAELGELVDRLERLDAEEDRVRAVLLERFTALETEATRRGLISPSPPAEKGPPRRRKGPQPAGRRKKRAETAGERGGAVVATRLGDRAHEVRQSKLALARYLRSKRPKQTARLRRSLARDARSGKNARLATPVWQRGVKAAQKVAGLPVTGEIDGPLHRVLRPHWPPDTVVRRAVRATPAWRVLPGQLTPNFNLRELGCKDGTPYVAGLMREKGLSKGDARRRAKGLAQRLEKVRKMNGGRPLRVTSAYRTERYNATLPGAAPNSAHTRGYAADQPPPPGITMEKQRQHVRAAFESGVGFYPRSSFVHGDFDPKLGRRSWVG